MPVTPNHNLRKLVAIYEQVVDPARTTAGLGPQILCNYNNRFTVVLSVADIDPEGLAYLYAASNGWRSKGRQGSSPATDYRFDTESQKGAVVFSVLERTTGEKYNTDTETWTENVRE